MGSASRASWAVAASVAAVEALKDQAGLCRWNYALRSMQQHAQSKAKSMAQAKLERARLTNNKTSASMVIRGYSDQLDEKMMKRRQAEKAERVYHLVCWGPS